VAEDRLLHNSDLAETSPVFRRPVEVQTSYAIDPVLSLTQSLLLFFASGYWT
jgi:hypothetical protein